MKTSNFDGQSERKTKQSKSDQVAFLRDENGAPDVMEVIEHIDGEVNRIPARRAATKRRITSTLLEPEHEI